ncbi:hypothetical protein CPB84DRAFT_1725221 [Gymnopilus junonius]|uniref:Uncharacterized protein n=1 Tax=Gymnopilus junonius TaxID=109634 RepID=A0A9P5NVN4_GYMJU|nr:hypothetical protein CPB84DRAFT_1725221 [Gymnopilus junonius]
MANLIRSAKSGSDWTINELLAFNIQVVPANTTVFFRNPELPQLSISPMILDNLQMPDGDILDDERDFFLHLSSVENGFEESAVDFAALLLRLLKYNSGRQRMIRSRKEISFIMAGQRVDAKTDICIIEDGLFILLVQEDRHQGQAYLHDIEPQLVAEAIAAFHQNNGNHRLAGLPELTYKLIPGIAMIGTAVVFYLIPVTKALDITFKHYLDVAITTASYPADEMVVLQFIPPVPDSAHYGDHGKGMWPLENRCIILQCFEAFKKFVVVSL